MAELPGICGPANRPCKISHSSTYTNQVGVYPSEFLPSTYTIWHAVFASQFPLQSQSTGGLDTLPIGGGLLPGLVIGGAFPGLTSPIVHTWQSHHHIIFARTENRVNVPYTLTEADIENINTLGISMIDIGDYIFEFVAATAEPIDFDLSLSEQEIEGLADTEECSIGCSPESEEDREFRKLFEQEIEGNRFRSVVVNTLGVEYRMDNGTFKSKQGLSQAGLGDLENASYRDGTSRKIEVQLMFFDSEGNELDLLSLEAGDTVYLTYVAVKKHYLRQRVNISWQTIDTGSIAECISLFLGYSIVHYRFYEWDMEQEPGQLPERLAGWRAVESFHDSASGLNFVSAIRSGGLVRMADFVIGNPDTFGAHTFDILPAKITVSQLEAIMSDRSTCPAGESCSISVNLDNQAPQGGSFHVNAGIGDPTDFRSSDWFQRNQFTTHLSQNSAAAHVFYNVHPRALRKRDIDKFGIERSLAVEIEKDINNGRITFFPFMDDPDVPNPTSRASEFLDSGNTLFEPVQPVTSYGGNFTAICGSIGSFPTNPASGINSYHSFESNRITERFDEGTRVLVERNFAVNADILGPRLITIEGAGGVRGSVTCLADPTQEFAFAGHTNDDGFLIYNSFSNGHAEEAIRSLGFRPDQASPPFKDNSSPTVDQFEPLVGFSGMIGDIPGIQPGRAIAIASSATHSSFIYKTTHPDELASANSFLSTDQIEEINLPEAETSPLVILASNAYYGSIQLHYDISTEGLEKDTEILILAKSGNDIVGVIDGFRLLDPLPGRKGYIQADLRWMRAASFEIVGDRVPYITVEKVTLRSISPDQASDFLDNVSSHSPAFASGSFDDRLIDNNLFFASDIVTMSEDEHSNLYVFFNDAEGGISAVGTNDFGDNWVYYYGVIEKIENFELVDPFAVTNFTTNSCYLFFNMGGKILCKKIPFVLFDQRDANLVERFAADVFNPGTADNPIPTVGASLYTQSGQTLRRGILSYVAAGDLTTEAFLEIAGKVAGEDEFDPFEQREINGELATVRKNPIAIAPYTAFTNADVNDIFFSAYQKDNGELRLWFMGLMQDSSNQLQCHFSADDGQSWYDLWEFLDFGYNRLRLDPEKNTQFIDRGANADVPTTLEGTDPREGTQAALLGINVHWSRLKRHKIDGGDVTILSESQVLEISSPYVFYQSATEQVFLFYIYEGCLLCKVFNDAIFTDAASGRASGSDEGGMTAVKTAIERQTRAYFVDGSLTDTTLQEEIHGFANDETEEIMAEGNIVFRYPFAVDNFGDDRTISAQRVCACPLPTGLVRVFYKHADSTNLKSALWTGTEWWAEDFLRNPENLNEFTLPDTSEYTEVTGGFGGTGFSP